MRNFLLPAAILTAAALPGAADADERFGCMAEDSRLKLAVHVEFADELGGRLSHLSGRFTVHEKGAPATLSDRRLSSQMLAQSWAEDGLVMVRLYDDSDRVPLDVTLAAAASGMAGSPLQGHYLIRERQEKGPGFHMEGALFCQRQPPRDPLSADPPSEAE